MVSSEERWRPWRNQSKSLTTPFRNNCYTQIYAFEPIPANYSVLVRNLYNTSSDSVKAGTCPKPVALRVALGADLAEEEFHFFEDNPGESTR